MNVLCASPWVPPEWIVAHGLRPQPAWCDAELNFGGALQAGMCAFSESLARLVTQRSSAAFVCTTHCDQLRRSYDSLVPGNRLFLLNLPATWQSPAAERMVSSEMSRFSRFLAELAGREVPMAAILEVAREHEASREQLRAMAGTCSGRAYAEAVARNYGSGTTKIMANAEPDSNTVRLALVGGPLSPAHWHIYDAIEALGAWVALDATDSGERGLGAPVSWDEAGWAKACLNRCVDVWQRPNSRLYQWLKIRLIERCIEGIVLWVYPACDLWRAEAQSLRDAFGLPVLLVEAGDGPGLDPRSRGRIEALVESRGVKA